MGTRTEGNPISCAVPLNTCEHLRQEPAMSLLNIGGSENAHVTVAVTVMCCHLRDLVVDLAYTSMFHLG